MYAFMRACCENDDEDVEDEDDVSVVWSAGVGKNSEKHFLSLSPFPSWITVWSSTIPFLSVSILLPFQVLSVSLYFSLSLFLSLTWKELTLLRLVHTRRPFRAPKHTQAQTLLRALTGTYRLTHTHFTLRNTFLLAHANSCTPVSYTHFFKLTPRSESVLTTELRQKIRQPPFSSVNCSGEINMQRIGKLKFWP